MFRDFKIPIFRDFRFPSLWFPRYGIRGGVVLGFRDFGAVWFWDFVISRRLDFGVPSFCDFAIYILGNCDFGILDFDI